MSSERMLGVPELFAVSKSNAQRLEIEIEGVIPTLFEEGLDGLQLNIESYIVIDDITVTRGEPPS